MTIRKAIDDHCQYSNHTLYGLALNAHDLHKRNGGCSLNVVTGETPKTGFMVSVADEFALAGDDLPTDVVKRYVAGDGRLTQFRRTNQIQNCYLGTWYDNSSPADNIGGISVLDISVNVATLGEAMDLARKNHQRAIYDVAKGETIYL